MKTESREQFLKKYRQDVTKRKWSEQWCNWCPQALALCHLELLSPEEWKGCWHKLGRKGCKEVNPNCPFKLLLIGLRLVRWHKSDSSPLLAWCLLYLSLNWSQCKNAEVTETSALACKDGLGERSQVIIRDAWWWQITAEYLKWTQQLACKLWKQVMQWCRCQLKILCPQNSFISRASPQQNHRENRSWDLIGYIQCRLWI